MEIETAVVHIGQTPDRQTGAIIPPIYATSTFVQISPGVTKGYDYTRSGNPSFSNLEKTLSSIERAEFATVFSSGMAAITAILSTMKHGDLVLAEENIYGCTYRIFATVFDKFGITIQYFDFADTENYQEILRQKPTAVWIESPTNPLLKILDIAKIASYCRKAGASLIVDNTFASPYFQRPLDLGADLSLSSTTKYINGHSDCLGGLVATNSGEWYDRMVFAQKAVGLNPSPFDAWLISRGVKTLPIRMKQHHKNALEFAQFLEAYPKVNFVRFPYLDSHPQYHLAKTQMTGGSGIVTAEFDLTLEMTKELISGFKVFALGESLGGVESLVCHPASMTHASIPSNERKRIGLTDGLVRFSIGIENIKDLIHDFNTAYRAAEKITVG